MQRAAPTFGATLPKPRVSLCRGHFGLGDVDGEDETRIQQEKVSKLREGGTRFLYKVRSRPVRFPVADVVSF